MIVVALLTDSHGTVASVGSQMLHIVGKCGIALIGRSRATFAEVCWSSTTPAQVAGILPLHNVGVKYIFVETFNNVSNL